jgi:hypothetical protein
MDELEMILFNESLGETHNFGQSVKRVSNSLIHKPRCIFWEWLFLGNSPLRELLDQILIDSTPITASWPRTTFLSNDDFQTGTVGVVSGLPLNTISLNEARQIGFTIGIALWFGLGDLHIENILAALDNKGRFVFAPLDIESVFEDVLLPSQTLLLPGPELPISKCGLGRIAVFLKDPALILEMCRGTLFGFNSLSDNSDAIKSLTAKMVFKYKPIIRKIVRSTQDYVDFMKGKVPSLPDKNPFCPSEKTQIARGDVPYFFRSCESDHLYFFSRPNEVDRANDLGSQFEFKSIASLIVSNSSPFWTRDNPTILRLSLIQIASKLAPKGKVFDCSMGNDRIYSSDSKLFLKVGGVMVSTNVS